MAQNVIKTAHIVTNERISKLATTWARLQNGLKYAHSITKACGVVLKHLQACLQELGTLDIVDPIELELDG